MITNQSPLILGIGASGYSRGRLIPPLLKMEHRIRSLAHDIELLLMEGGNYAQFGWYRPQTGDNPATISTSEQQEQTVNVTLQLSIANYL